MAERQVLLVDDSKEWQDTLAGILRRDGYQVDVAGSLSATAERLAERMYHLVILDIRLEDWDTTNTQGMTVLDELHRRYGETDAISKIMISAHSTMEQMRQAFKQEVFDFILKDEFDDDEFRAIVRDVFEKEVRVAPELSIVLEDGLTIDKLIVGVARGNRRVQPEDPDFARLVIELEDLFRRLFYDRRQIVIRPVTSGHGKAGVVKVDPFSKDGHDETVIVKHGDHWEIDREYRNYEDFVKGKIGTRAPSVLNLRRTPLLGGIVYLLIGAQLDRVTDFARFYQRRSIDEIGAMLDDLFKGTCANWYADRGVVQYCPLDELYASALDFRREQLLEALAAHFPQYAAQNMLVFREAGGDAGLAVPNPAYAAQERTLSRSTYLCTTHGDLNANNILVDDNGHTWLIDFYRTGKGHILRDCVQLETVVKFDLLRNGELKERYRLEQALAGMAAFRDVDRLRYDAPNEAYAKAFEVCRKLRQIARDLVQPNDDFSQYEIGLLYCSMNTQRFYALPPVNRLHALMAAGMLCQKLGLMAA